MPNQPPAQLMLGLAPPACAPHPANGVRKDQQHWLSQASESPQTLDLFVGRAKVLGRTSPRCCRAQPNRITAFKLSIRLQIFHVVQVVKSLKNIPPIRLATIRNPHRPSKKDQKGTSCLADIAQKCLVHHDAASEESTFKPSKNLLVIVLVLARCFSLLGCLLGFPLQSGFFIIVLAFWSWKLSCQQDLQHCVAPTAHYCMIFCN